MRLYGITNVYYTDTFDLTNAFTLDQSVYNILLAHITNFEDFADFGMDLSICGDTHGGQVRLPYLGGLINQGLAAGAEGRRGKVCKGPVQHG